ncbi:MAG: hypothetical protein ABIT37_15555 [Luteolibacter sp.]
MNKDLRNTSIWLVFATLMLTTAIWQAQVAAAKDAQASHKTPPPPAKTRHAVRQPSSVLSGDSVTNYGNRIKKGLTDQDIGWIVEDFKNAGLDLGIRVATSEEYLAQRKAQDRWYHDALVEAWSLTPEQAAQVTAKLAELFEQAKADFLQALAASPNSFGLNGKKFQIISAGPIHQLIDANLRFQTDNTTFLPWNLCSLPDHDDHRRKENDSAPGGIPQQEYQSEILDEPVLAVPAAPNIVSVDRLMPLLPPPSPPPEEKPTLRTQQENGLLGQFRKLHPAQFKILLLIDPEQIADIQGELDKEK